MFCLTDTECLSVSSFWAESGSETSQNSKIHRTLVWKRYLLNELNARSQVHPKVNELPFNSFLLVLLLLQHEHVVVEELLQLLIGEVDAQLLKAVELPKARRGAQLLKVWQTPQGIASILLKLFEVPQLKHYS